MLIYSICEGCGITTIIDRLELHKGHFYCLKCMEVLVL
jgi:RNA polymerase-binding transcription factor DksA